MHKHKSYIMWEKPWAKVQEEQQEFLEYSRHARAFSRDRSIRQEFGPSRSLVMFTPYTIWVHEFEDKLSFTFMGVRFHYNRDKDMVNVAKKQVIFRFMIKKTKQGTWRVYTVSRSQDMRGRVRYSDMSNNLEYWFDDLIRQVRQCTGYGPFEKSNPNPTLIIVRKMNAQINAFFEARGVHGMLLRRTRPAVTEDEYWIMENEYIAIRENLQVLMFPLLRDIKLEINEWIPHWSGQGALLRQHTPKAVLQKVLGKRATIKPLAKAWGAILADDPQTAFEHLSGLRYWRDFLTREQLVQLLRLATIPSYDTYNLVYGRLRLVDPYIHERRVAFTRHVLELYGRDRIMRMNMEDAGNTHHMFADCERIIRQNQFRGNEGVELVYPRRPNTWGEIHDLLLEQVPQPRVIHAGAGRRYVHEEIPEEVPSDLYIDVDSTVVGDLLIKAPEKTTDLVAWSEAMGNCISSYRRDCALGQGLYLAVYKGHTLYANIEVRDGKVKQLLGRFNKNLPKDEVEAIMAHFESVGFATGKGFWGDSRGGRPDRDVELF